MNTAGSASLHLHGGGGVGGNGQLTGPDGQPLQQDEYGHDDQVAAAYAASGQLHVEGDESQTGPIRGAYATRAELGGQVWRPY